jgi:hypothetical protein
LLLISQMRRRYWELLALPAAEISQSITSAATSSERAQIRVHLTRDRKQRPLLEIEQAS